MEKEQEYAKLLRKEKTLNNKKLRKWRAFKKDNADAGLTKYTKEEDLKIKVVIDAWGAEKAEVDDELKGLKTKLETTEAEVVQLFNGLNGILETFQEWAKHGDARGLHINDLLERWDKAKHELQVANSGSNKEQQAEAAAIVDELSEQLFENEEREQDFHFYHKRGKESPFLADLGRIMRHYLLFKTYAGDLTRIIDRNTLLPNVKIELKIFGEGTTFDGIKQIPPEGLNIELNVGYDGSDMLRIVVRSQA